MVLQCATSARDACAADLPYGNARCCFLVVCGLIFVLLCIALLATTLIKIILKRFR